MSELRLDIRKMLLKRGWEEPHGPGRVMKKGRAAWASVGSGDSSLSAYRNGRACEGAVEFTLGFPGDTPARVVVAACEAAQKSMGEPA